MGRYFMKYLRTGACNLCGECCGYPRATDQGQNNAWPEDWPESLSTWSKESLPKIFELIDINKKEGITYLNKKEFAWKFSRGICKSDTNLECPFLSEKLEDGTVPCLLKNTTYNSIWEDHCNNVPPQYFENKESLENWNRNCPSCSFVYEEVK